MSLTRNCRVFLLLFVVCLFAQQKICAQLKLENESGFKNCSAVNFAVSVRNTSSVNTYEEGSFGIIWGDGKSVHGLSYSEVSSQSHTYSYGVFDLKFYAMPIGGSIADTLPIEVVNESRQPAVGISASQTGTFCVGGLVEFIIDKYNENSRLTKYILDYGDKRDVDIVTYDQLVSQKGAVLYTYEKSHCELNKPKGIDITVTAQNGCGKEKSAILQNTYVVKPPTPDFFCPEKKCTWEVVTFKNTTEDGYGEDCSETIKNEYTWVFQNEKGGRDTVRAINPIRVYTIPGVYEVTLIGDNGYCAGEGKTKTIKIIERVVADFSVTEEEKRCSEESVLYTNQSTGDERKHKWEVNPLSALHGNYKFESGTGVNTENIQLSFDYGTFEVKLHVWNDCSDSTKYDTIHIRKDPKITKFDALPAMCPEVDGYNGILQLNSNIVNYEWYNNEHKLTWMISGQEGADWQYVGNTNMNSLYPQIKFINPGNYTLTVKLEDAGCGAMDVQLKGSQSITIFDPEIHMNIAEKDNKTSVCEQEEIQFINSSSAVQEIKQNWTVTKAGGTTAVENTDYVFLSGTKISKEPHFKFLTYGDYVVTATLSVECNSCAQSFPFHVRKDPEVTKLKEIPVGCIPYVVNMREYRGYEWFNNTEHKLNWKITGGVADGGEILPPATATSETPVFRFSKPGEYNVIVELDGVACQGEKRIQDWNVVVLDPTVKKDITLVGGTTLCENDKITFSNDTKSLIPITYEWTLSSKNDVYADRGYSFTGGTAKESPAPEITFTRYGVYTIVTHLSTSCNLEAGPTTESFTVTVQRDPEVIIAPLTSICPADELVFDTTNVFYKWNDNTAQMVYWEVTRTDGSPATDVVYESGALYPKVKFAHPGKYKVFVSLELPAGCNGLKLNDSKEITVHDTVMKLNVSPMTQELCQGETFAFTNSSTAAEQETYKWTVTPVGGAAVGGWAWGNGAKDSDKAPAIVFNQYGEYAVKVVMTGNGRCVVKEQEMMVTVRKDPGVVLKDFDPMCPGELTLATPEDFTWRDNVPAVKWTVNAPVGIAPVEGDLSVICPTVKFTVPGDYEIIAELTTNGCPGEHLTDRKMVTIFPPDIKIDVKIANEVEEGKSLKITNNSLGEIKSYRWSVDGPPGGAAFIASTTETDKEPEIEFTKFGLYKIRLDIAGTCTDSVQFFEVMVKGIPSYTFKEFKDICAGETLDMNEYLTYDSKGAIIVAHWTITPDGDGEYEYINTEKADILLPVIHFKKNGQYTMLLTADAEFGGRQIFTQKINVLSTEVKALTLTDQEGCTDLVLELKNQSAGDSLQYEWLVTPVGIGWEYISGTSESRTPSVKFTQQANYTVKLRTWNICNEDMASFTVRAYSKPEIEPISDILDVCERGFVFQGDALVKVHENGDPINEQLWTISPSGYHFTTPDDAQTLHPDITFDGSNTPYLLKLEIRNGCAETISEEFKIFVDKFEEISPKLRDTVICALSAPLLLKAHPEGGNWGTLFPTDMIDSVNINEWYFNPRRDETEIFEVEYRRGHKSCLARDTMEIKVNGLPIVNAGIDLERCINLPPLELGDQNPQGGTWEGTGVINGWFDPLVPGVDTVRLDYVYTDLVTMCTNLDSVTAIVRPLPDVTFKTAAEHCRSTDSLFIPNALNVGNQYSWDFGDGSDAMLSTGEILHRYETPGFYNVLLTATSPHSCVLTAAPVQIEVFNQPPPAEFTMDTVKGCGPLDVKFSVNPVSYDDPFAHLSYVWVFGNGMESHSLQPSPDVLTFQSRDFDTTYQVTFKVYNICDAKTQTQDIQVFSSPKAKFLMSPDEGCSPLEVAFINLSTGSDCEYSWSFGDGTTNIVDKEPRNVYTAGNKASFYEVILSAFNACIPEGVTFQDTLMVKPNTLNAVFKADKHFICFGDTICFTNYSSDTSTAILSQTWTFGDGQFSPLWDTCHQYQTIGKLGVTLKLDNGCAKSAFTDSITVYSIPKLDIASNAPLCEDDTFHFELSTDQPLKKIDWTFGDEGEGHGLVMDHIYANPGNYPVTVTVQSAEIPSCPARGTKTIEVWPKPDVRIVPLDTTVCGPYLYQPQWDRHDYYFTWDYGTGEKLTSKNEHLYVNDTNFILDYNLVAHVETNRGCKTEYNGHIKLYNNPKAKIGKEISYGRPEKVDFINLTRDYTECIWYLPDGKVVNSPDNQVMYFEEKALFPLSLAAVNEYGCRDSVALEHRSYMSGLFFPNTFIPHSGNAKVNAFSGVGMGLKEYELIVYDGYGNKIWETNKLLFGEPAEGWDGKNKMGEDLPQGVYIWRARAIFFSEDLWTGDNNGSGNPQTTQGTVLMLRE